MTTPPNGASAVPKSLLTEIAEDEIYELTQENIHDCSAQEHLERLSDVSPVERMTEKHMRGHYLLFIWRVVLAEPFTRPALLAEAVKRRLFPGVSIDEMRRRVALFDRIDVAGDAQHALEKRDTVVILHPAQDAHDGVLWIGVPTPSGLVLVNSRREAIRPDELPEGVTLKHTNVPTCSWSRDALLAFLSGTGPTSLASLIDKLAQFYARYMILPETRLADALALWTVGTYYYRACRLFPYLHLRSPEKRCGKSRLLRLISSAAFASSGVMTRMTEATLFRLAEQTGGTQCLDEVEHLADDKDLSRDSSPSSTLDSNVAARCRAWRNAATPGRLFTSTRTSRVPSRESRR